MSPSHFYMRALSLTLGSGLMLVSAWALAADPPPPSVIRGKIARLDAKSISIRQADGTVVTASLAPGTAFSTVEPRRFEQIGDTDFVGVTTVPGPNDTLTAQEIHILPWRGLDEGSFPWNHGPAGDTPAPRGTTNGTVAAVHDDGSETFTMTNASVTASSGGTLTVSYQGAAMVGGKCVGRAAKAAAKPCHGTATVVVAPSTPIAAVVPARPTDAKPGGVVFAILTKKPNGQWAALSLIFETKGVKPLF
jgi:hypothetical protein